MNNGVNTTKESHKGTPTLSKIMECLYRMIDNKSAIECSKRSIEIWASKEQAKND